MNSLIHALSAQLQNQFVGGGLVLMFTGSIVALMRRTPFRVWHWVKKQATRSIVIENSDPLFDYMTYWLNSQERFRKSRSLRATTSLSLGRSNSSASDGPCEIGQPKKRKPLEVFFSPSSGRHLMRYRDTWVSIGRNTEAPDNGSSDGNQGHLRRESYLIEAYGRCDGEVLKDLVREVVGFGTEETDGVRLYHNVWGGWESNGYIRMRPLKTVVLPAGAAEAVLSDMRDFRNSESWYRNLGIPWHRGYLFYGLPGTGKSSLAAALAGELEMDVYLLCLSGTGMNDEKLESLMGRVRPGCMVILEDVDCTVPVRDARPDANRITLSGLLNCLDGITSREGCIIVMTTNRRETLDSALTRPGRIDLEMEFGYATDEQMDRLATRIGVSADGLHGQPLTMAEVQKELLQRHRASAVAASLVGSSAAHVAASAAGAAS